MSEQLSEKALAFVPGKYRHFKNKDYVGLFVVRHSETLEELVCYQPMYDGLGLRLRPIDNFSETITRDGQAFQRFILVPGDLVERPGIEKSELSEIAQGVKLGKYRHFKGCVVVVHGIALWGDFDDPAHKDEEYVIYQHTEEENTCWARPLAMFLDTVDKGDGPKKRFEFIG